MTDLDFTWDCLGSAKFSTGARRFLKGVLARHPELVSGSHLTDY